MVKKTFRVTNETGIHARPATTLVNTAMKFDSDVLLHALNKAVDMKSIMGVMSLGIYSGADIVIECDGRDEEAAVAELAKVLGELNLAKEI